ncbi:PREDICTED: UPF0545 protein C22orf39 homolog, partial [Priapulus caudatus]|uniref:Synaptic plasticity regulator PANTS n=1 Tax=Priapulus caudatus TaxID=37621 RepID=A0ABM1F0W9_PRICU
LSPCEIYWEQYKECTSVRGKFHQYFIHGQQEECGQWKSDYDNCMKWKKKENKDALGEVLGNERRRLGDRLRASYANDVWELRDGPPATWAAPLPAWLQRENENTYLAVKCEQRHRDGDAAAAAAAARFAEPSRCTIL